MHLQADLSTFRRHLLIDVQTFAPNLTNPNGFGCMVDAGGNSRTQPKPLLDVSGGAQPSAR
jgi:hypothetical protein